MKDKSSAKPNSRGVEKLIAEIKQKIQALESMQIAAPALEETIGGRTAQQIDRAKEEWETTVDSLRELIFLVADDGRIIRANRSLEKWNLGRVETIKGQELHAVLHEKCPGACYFETLWRDIRWHRQSVTPREMEAWDEHLNRYLHVQVQPLSIGKRRQETNFSAVVVIEDISQRKSSEEKIRQSAAELQALVNADTALNNFRFIFSGIRHEIGNPLNSIKVTLSVLREKLGTEKEGFIRDYVDRSLNEVNRIESLLKSLKNSSFFEKVEITDVPILPFIEQFFAGIAKELERKGIHLHHHFAHATGTARCDPRALEQVLRNLIDDATEALAGVSDPEISLAVERRGGECEISIKDNGAGSEADHMQNLLHPFFGDKTGRAKLGLVMIKEILVMMNGSISIESQADMGTLVTIRLPAG